jgi:hypothetical protein
LDPQPNPSDLTFRSFQQNRRLNLRPFAFQNTRHHLQNITLTLAHLNPVFLHPSLSSTGHFYLAKTGHYYRAATTRNGCMTVSARHPAS